MSFREIILVQVMQISHLFHADRRTHHLANPVAPFRASVGILQGSLDSSPILNSVVIFFGTVSRRLPFARGRGAVSITRTATEAWELLDLGPRPPV